MVFKRNSSLSPSRSSGFCEGHYLNYFGELETLAFKDGILLEEGGQVLTRRTLLVGEKREPVLQGRRQQTGELTGTQLRQRPECK